MIPAEMDPISITTIRENGMKSIVDWFDQHMQSLYFLGWSYLGNQQQMEELFYQSIIKVHKELPRFNKETSIKTMVTSTFIHTCRELSKNRSLQAFEESEQTELFQALDHLKEIEKEAVVLTYINGLSHEEVAHLLQVSVDELKEHLFFGIQSLRKGMDDGSSFNGCKEYHTYYIDYLEGTLDRSKNIDFEIHIYHCLNCRKDLAAFQDTMLNLPERIEELRVPSGFMENVRARLADQEKHRQQKNRKRKRMGIGFASVFVLLMGLGFFTGAFTNLYYTWTVDDQELRAFLQEDLGERLNLEAESNGVKIRIKSVIADDIQTLVFYEIEDTNEENQYVISFDDGFFVENGYEIMNNEAYPKYYPPDLESDLNQKDRNVYHGKISMQPLIKDKGTIKLKITQLRKLIHDSPERNSLWAYGETEKETGEWNFEIPVTKQPSKEYVLHEEIEVEGIPVRFDKLIFAPTATILQYAINNKQTEKQINNLNFNTLEVNDKKVKADMYGGIFLEGNMGWTTFQTHFDPIFGEKPKEVNAQFDSVHLMVEDQKRIELDASQEYPQTFEYAGSKISIDKVEIGKPSKVVISNYEIKNRAFESLNLNILDENKNGVNSMAIDSQGVLVDKNGVEQDMDVNPITYEEIEQPRYFDTVLRMSLNNDNAEKVIPKTLVIHGYSTTKYMDDVVSFSLE
ncbi:sigma-70 family RNA polymerase sigma factor [Virgibacillus oceani]|uniref:DUF4179 domain-containing protein n=1 Tax=Virgibacillus oceani TaxID=1479511 RepID=A0A917HEN6_9BACI|nr:sigma-70 family RNA polymerase sigma factor [Virgibacillus oceani]GGG76742.1 hypothetical protein GCM10011398_22210 [Virgibacillus oceani]